MDALEMIKREPFYDILKETIGQYYKDVLNDTIAFTESKQPNTTTLFFYLVPSFLAARRMTKEMRRFLYTEYNIRGNILKYIIGKVGVFGITHSYGLAAAMKFYVHSSYNMRECFISPCNRSIRFYNFKENYVDCMVKSRYDNVYMQRQLQFRLNCKYDFVPRIISYEDRWYREEIMHGNALARVTDENTYKSSEKAALDHLGILACDTLQNIPIDEYLKILEAEYDTLIECFSHEYRQQINDLWGLNIGVIRERQKSVELTVPTAVTHGDFQGGNIWVNKEHKVTIYDWETVKRRSVWYDPATLAWGLHSHGVSTPIEQYVMNDTIFLFNDAQKEYDHDQRRAIADVIYLENVLFFLDELEQIPTEYSTSNCERFISSLKSDLARKKVLHE